MHAVAETCNDNPCGLHSTCVPKLIGGGYTCQCAAGYTGEPPYCTGTSIFTFAPLIAFLTIVDINECNGLNLCTLLSGCTNTEGSYYCSCPAGFQPLLTSIICIGRSIFLSFLSLIFIN